MANIASYELSVPPRSTPPSILFNQPIMFYEQKVLEGNDIQSVFPYNDFTLAPGEYQINVGLANNGGESGPASNLQLEVFLNSRRIFVWPAPGHN